MIKIMNKKVSIMLIVSAIAGLYTTMVEAQTSTTDGVNNNDEKPQITEAQKDRDASTPTPPPAVEVAKPEEEVTSTDFTGIAKEYQVIPNTLAIYCQANAQDFATDRTKMVGCVNKIISKLKADRAETLRNVTEPVRIEMLEEAIEIHQKATRKK